MGKTQCPKLVMGQTRLSCTEQGASYTKTWFSDCIGSTCAAYKPDRFIPKCLEYNTYITERDMGEDEFQELLRAMKEGDFWELAYIGGRE